MVVTAGVGLTVNEIKGVLVHLYAYTGFPRSLNAMGAFMQVMDERKAEDADEVLNHVLTSRK